MAVVGEGGFRDVEARLVSDAGSPAEAARAGGRRSGGPQPRGRAWTRSSSPLNVVPSRLEVPDPPPFAVAWTA